MRVLIVSCLFLVALSSVSAQEEKIFTQLTTEQTEGFLKKFEIEFKKVDTKSPGTFFYDFQRKGFNVRLYHFDGKDLMLDAVFPKMPLERVNSWNVKAKFSRACLNRDPKGEFVTLESNLDLIGGVTEGGLKQFLYSFDEELRLFARFLGNSASDDVVYSPVTPEKIENVLKSLGLAFEKVPLKDGVGEFYDFEAANFKIRLINFGGKDLMIDAHFKKLSLEDLNQWNLQKKFIRAVGYDVKGQQYSALETNLDCEAGITDGILRNYIVGFQEDVKQFAKYVQSR